MGLKNRSSVTLHVGQCGVQCAPVIWNMMAKEHDPLELQKIEGESPQTIYRETSNGKWIPRALLVDLDPSTIDAVKMSQHKEVFSMDSFISGSEDGASCYARARYVQGYEIIGPAREALRRQLEACNVVLSIVHNCATSGGTGSGIVPDILTAEFSKRSYCSLGLEVYCSPSTDNALGFYNTVLHMNSMTDFVDLNIVTDNDALFKIAKNRYGAALEKYPTFADINQQISAIFSCLTSGERFAASNLDMARFQTTLVPYQGLSYVSATVCSYQEPMNRAIPVMNLMEDAYGDMTSCSIKRHKGEYFGSYIVVRGDCRISFETKQEIHQMVQHKRFASWVPCKFTFAHCKRGLPNDMKPHKIADQTITHFYNHSDITSLFETYSKWFGVSHTRRSFFQWYVDNGMHEREFSESLESLAILQRVYKSIGNFQADDDQPEYPNNE